MAVARTADAVGVMGEDCQTTVRLSGSLGDYWEGQKSEFYLKLRKAPRRIIPS